MLDTSNITDEQLLAIFAAASERLHDIANGYPRGGEHATRDHNRRLAALAGQLHACVAHRETSPMPLTRWTVELEPSRPDGEGAAFDVWTRNMHGEHRDMAQLLGMAGTSAEVVDVREIPAVDLVDECGALGGQG